MIILVATNEEYDLAKRYLPGFMIVRTGVGANNVIRTLCSLPCGTAAINIGFCGSNKLPVGSVVKVNRTYRLINNKVEFEDYRNGDIIDIALPGDVDCYTSNSFVTENTHNDSVVYDMELNYIAAFPIKLIGAIKIVSDNLSVKQYEQTIAVSTEEQWAKVRALVYEMLEPHHPAI